MTNSFEDYGEVVRKYGNHPDEIISLVQTPNLRYDELLSSAHEILGTQTITEIKVRSEVYQSDTCFDLVYPMKLSNNLVKIDPRTMYR